MKKTFALCFLLSAFCFLTGCASTPIFDAVPEIVTITNRVRVIEVVTNTVPVPSVVRDAAGVVTLVTNLVAVPVFFTNTVAVTELVTNTIYEVSDKVTGYVATARGIGSTISTIAPPAAPIVSAVEAVLGLGVVLLGLFARVKTNLASKNKSALQKTGTMLRAVVTGVEAANNSNVKALISQHASVADVAHELDGVVQAVSTTMARSPKPATT